MEDLDNNERGNEKVMELMKKMMVGGRKIISVSVIRVTGII